VNDNNAAIKTGAVERYFKKLFINKIENLKNKIIII
jgi:hypothetical protein